MVSPTTFLGSSVGKKIVMAITGIVLSVFVLGHMAGNLQAFLPNGPEALDHYGAFLKGMLHGAGIWFVRGGLLVAVVLHAWAYLTLTTKSWAARCCIRPARPENPKGSCGRSRMTDRRTPRWSPSSSNTSGGCGKGWCT